MRWGILVLRLRFATPWVLIPDTASDCAIGLAHDRDLSCSPRLCQLRHRGDVEQGPASAPTLLMTWLAMLEGADAYRGEGRPKGAPSKKFRYSSLPRVPRRDAGFPLPDATASQRLLCTSRPGNCLSCPNDADLVNPRRAGQGGQAGIDGPRPRPPSHPQPCRGLPFPLPRDPGVRRDFRPIRRPGGTFRNRRARARMRRPCRTTDGSG
jgi:hypothetical protein